MRGAVDGFPGWEAELFVASSAGAWVDDPCLPGESLDGLVVLYLRWAGHHSGWRSARRFCWSAQAGWRMLSSRARALSPASLVTVLGSSGPPLPSGLAEAVEGWVPPLTPEFLTALLVMSS